MLYILTSVWVLRTPNTGQNSHFQRFCAKRWKNAKKVANVFVQENLTWLWNSTHSNTLFWEIFQQTERKLAITDFLNQLSHK